MAICGCGNKDDSLPDYVNWECWQCLFERFGRLSPADRIKLRIEIDGLIVQTKMDCALQEADNNE